MGSRVVLPPPGSEPSDADTEDSGFEAPAPTVANAQLMTALASGDFEQRCRAIEDAVDVVDPEALLDLVADQTDARRRNAAMEVLERAGARSVPALIKALKSSDLELVMFAATMLGKTRAPSCVPHLIKLLGHDEVNIVVAAVDSLGQLRSRAAVRPLATILDRDPWLRFAATHSLGEIASPEAVEILEPLLDDPMLHDIVLTALGSIGSVRALPRLLSLLHDAADQGAFDACLCAVARIVQQQADRGLLRMVPGWLDLREDLAFRERITAAMDGQAQSDERALTRRAAAQLICALHIDSLFPELIRAAEDSELRDVLHFYVLELGPRTGPSLIAGMLSGDAGVRAFCCSCIGTLGLRAAVPNILIALDDQEASVRAAAVGTLAQINVLEAVPRIVAALQDPALSVREAAREALAHMDPVTVSMALTWPPPSGREQLSTALDILAVNPHVQTKAFLSSCVGHQDPEVRRRAARALARLPGFENSGVPEVLLADEDVDVRLETVRALPAPRRLTIQSKLLEFIASDPALRADAVRSLAALGDPALATRITQILMERTEACDALVAEALAEMGQPVCAPLLVRLLASTDVQVRRLAVTGIARIASPVAVAHATAARDDDDPEVRLAAVEMLARARDRVSLERLIMDPDSRVAKRARRALEDLASVS